MTQITSHANRHSDEVRPQSHIAIISYYCRNQLTHCCSDAACSNIGEDHVASATKIDTSVNHASSIALNSKINSMGNGQISLMRTNLMMCSLQFIISIICLLINYALLLEWRNTIGWGIIVFRWYWKKTQWDSLAASKVLYEHIMSISDARMHHIWEHVSASVIRHTSLWQDMRMHTHGPVEEASSRTC